MKTLSKWWTFHKIKRSRESFKYGSLELFKGFLREWASVPGWFSFGPNQTLDCTHWKKSDWCLASGQTTYQLFASPPDDLCFRPPISQILEITEFSNLLKLFVNNTHLLAFHTLLLHLFQKTQSVYFLTFILMPQASSIKSYN